MREWSNCPWWYACQVPIPIVKDAFCDICCCNLSLDREASKILDNFQNLCSCVHPDNESVEFVIIWFHWLCLYDRVESGGKIYSLRHTVVIICVLQRTVVFAERGRAVCLVGRPNPPEVPSWSSIAWDQQSQPFWCSDQFRGRQFFHGCGGVGGGWWFWDDSSALHLLCTSFLLLLYCDI